MPERLESGKGLGWVLFLLVSGIALFALVITSGVDDAGQYVHATEDSPAHLKIASIDLGTRRIPVDHAALWQTALSRLASKTHVSEERAADMLIAAHREFLGRCGSPSFPNCRRRNITLLAFARLQDEGISPDGLAPLSHDPASWMTTTLMRALNGLPPIKRDSAPY